MKHIGFENAAKGLAKKQKLSMDSARSILASAARHASKKAVKRNPRLLRVRR